MRGGQYGEDPILLDHFKNVPQGYLVDVGAANGEDNSNSLCLLERGWRGLLVEPEPEQFQALQTLHRDRSGVICLRTAVGRVPGRGQLWCGGQVSTLKEDWRDRCIQVHGINYRSIEVPVKRLDDLLDVVGAPPRIDFLTVDCEGMDLSVLESMDWRKYQVQMVCVEERTDCADRLLKEVGLVPLIRTHGNWIYARSD